MCLPLHSTKSPNLASTSSETNPFFLYSHCPAPGPGPHHLHLAHWCFKISRFLRSQSLSSVYFGEGNGTPLQYSCLENSMDGGAWWAVIHGVAKSQTWLRDFTFTFHFHALEKEMATHSGVLAWGIPEMGEPSGLPFMGLHRVGYNWNDLAAAAAIY